MYAMAFAGAPGCPWRPQHQNKRLRRVTGRSSPNPRLGPFRTWLRAPLKPGRAPVPRLAYRSAYSGPGHRLRNPDQGRA